MHRHIGGGGRTVNGLQVCGFHKPVVSREAIIGMDLTRHWLPARVVDGVAPAVPCGTDNQILEDVEKNSRPNFYNVDLAKNKSQHDVF
ncbi:MAG: hypothetical protein MZV65_14320 [Chromatiales bacterium]|nr:hypothetical protein [Chromatiales bacterium]